MKTIYRILLLIPAALIVVALRNYYPEKSMYISIAFFIYISFIWSLKKDKNKTNTN